MNLCLSSFAYIRYPIETAIERTAKSGYDAIEIVANRPHMLPEDYDNSQKKKILSQAKSLGLKVAMITSFNGTAQWHFTHPNPRVRSATVRHVKECVDLASDLEAPLVGITTGMPMIEGTSEKDQWKWLRAQLEECADYAKSHKKQIGLEPEPGNLISTSSLGEKMISEVNNPSLQLLMDIGHLHVMKEDIPKTVLRMRNKIIHIHIHDNDSTRDAHLVPGEGNIDFKAIVKALRETNYSGYLSAELEQGEGDVPVVRAREYILQLLS